MSHIRIARVVTVPEAFVHFKPFLNLLKNKEIEITLISSGGAYEKVLQDELQLAVTQLEIKREIDLYKDFKALISLIKIFRNNKFDIIHSSTPKAGLLVCLAGLFVPSSIRIHTFTGQRWAQLTGFKRTLLKFFDQLIIKLNTQCYADSFSQIQYLIKEGVAKPDQVKSLHKGSYGGIDIDRFNSKRFSESRLELMSELRLSADSIFVLFVGQICEDKGINELVRAFAKAQETESRLKLILIGVYREGVDQIDSDVFYQIKNNPHIFSLGYKTQPEKYFSAADFLCLPSHREGFGTVVIEAAACGLPTLGTRIPGLVDAVLDNETGLLVELGNPQQLADSMLKLAKDEVLRKKLGEAARKRAHADFDSKFISEIQWQEYQSLLKTRSE